MPDALSSAPGWMRPSAPGPPAEPKNPRPTWSWCAPSTTTSSRSAGSRPRSRPATLRAFLPVALSTSTWRRTWTSGTCTDAGFGPPGAASIAAWSASSERSSGATSASAVFLETNTYGTSALLPAAPTGAVQCISRSRAAAVFASLTTRSADAPRDAASFSFARNVACWLGPPPHGGSLRSTSTTLPFTSSFA